MSADHVSPSAHTSKVPSALKRRVFGIPVLYLVAGFVIALALYAWKSKTSHTADAATTTPDNANVDPSAATDATSAMFPATNAGGTVVVQPVPMGDAGAKDNANTSIDSNSEWLSRGVAFLGSRGVGAGAAQGALQTYLDGGSLNTVQGGYRNQVVAELGLPPDGARVTGTDLRPVANPRRSMGFYKYVGSGGAWAIYELFDDKTKRLVTASEWKTKANTPTKPIDRATLDQYRTWN